MSKQILAKTLQIPIPRTKLHLVSIRETLTTYANVDAMLFSQYVDVLSGKYASSNIMLQIYYSSNSSSPGRTTPRRQAVTPSNQHSRSGTIVARSLDYHIRP